MAAKTPGMYGEPRARLAPATVAMGGAIQHDLEETRNDLLKQRERNTCWGKWMGVWMVEVGAMRWVENERMQCVICEPT